MYLFLTIISPKEGLAQEHLRAVDSPAKRLSIVLFTINTDFHGHN